MSIETGINEALSVDAQRFTAPETVQWSEMGGEVVLVDLQGELMYGLDAMGSDIWLRLMRGETPRLVAQTIAAQFSVEESRVHADVTRLVRELTTQGLLLARLDD